MFINLKKILAVSGLIALTCMPAIASNPADPNPIAAELMNRFQAKMNSAEFAHVPVEAKQLIRDNVDALHKGACVDVAEVKARYDQIIATIIQHKMFSNPYFYEITYKGTKTYLLGSQHTSQLAELCPAVKIYMNACFKLWTECEGSDMASLQKIHATLIRKGLAKYPLHTWIQWLTPEARDKVNFMVNYFQTQHGLDISTMHPLVFYYIMEEMNLTGSSYYAAREAVGMDSELMNSFAIASKPNRFLETSATRVRDEKSMDELVALSGERLSDSTTRLNIRCGLAEVFSKGVAANSQCVLEDLCYLFGLADLNEIDRYDNYSLVDGKMVRDVALDARNKRWHKEIKKAEKAGEFNQVSAMCVGLAHLPGSTGLLPFYFKKGATIKRMDRGGQFTIRAFQDAQNRWIETPEAAVVPLQPQLVPYVAATRTNFNPDRYFALNQDFLNSPVLGAMAVDKRRVWLTDHYFNHGINEKRRWQ